MAAYAVYDAAQDVSRNKPKRNGQCREDQAEYKDLLKRKFKVQAPNLAWVSDITYVRVANGFNYVCTVMDLYSRKIIAWKVARNPNSILVLQTLEEAWKIRGKPEAVIFHSDRGTQYTSKMIREALSAKNFVQSFSKSGSPYDNAVVEAFFRLFERGRAE